MHSVQLAPAPSRSLNNLFAASLSSVSFWPSRAVGRGFADTNSIVSRGGGVTPDTTGAAHYSRFPASCGSKTDWFLPSVGEALPLLSNLPGLGLFQTDTAYWTSNEIDATTAATMNFNLASIGIGSKSSSLNVCPIREF